MLVVEQVKHLPDYAETVGQVRKWRPSRALRRRLRTPERISVSTWAERYRRVTGIDSDPGPWRNDLVPHLVKPMDTVSLPHVREVWICAPERGAKTQLMMNTAFWGVDQGSKGGSIFWLMPREKDARDAMADRIIPAMRARDDHGKPNRLARYLSDKDDDTKRGMVRFNHGMFLRPAWSNSPAALASYFGFINIADEVDKFETTSKEGTNPIELFRKRARDDRERSKYVFGSTPGAGRYIYSGVMDCDQVWQFHLRCPDCGELVFQTEEHLHLDEDTDSSNIKKRGCSVACPDCGTLWDDAKRRTAYDTGAWVCIEGQNETRPETVGFHLSGFCLPKIKLSELGEKWLRAETGTYADKANWVQGYRCQDYESSTSEKLNIQALAERRESYGSQVPAEAGYITAGVDVQGDRIEIEVIAWGLGLETWGLDYRQIFGDTSLPYVWEELDKYLQQTWQHSSGAELRIGCACIDSGFRAPHVYAYTHNKRFRGIVAIKGASTDNHPLVKGPNNIKHGRIKVPVASIGTDEGKRLLFDHLQREQPGPGYCHFPEHYPDNYFRMLGAEEYQEKRTGGRIVGEWVKVSSRNESIDLRVYNYAALTIASPNLEKIIEDLNHIEEIEEPQQPSIIEQRRQARRPGKGGFVTGWKR